MAARTNEVVMAAIRADPQILEEHLAVEATIDASRIDAATRLSMLGLPVACAAPAFPSQILVNYAI